MYGDSTDASDVFILHPQKTVKLETFHSALQSGRYELSGISLIDIEFCVGANQFNFADCG